MRDPELMLSLLREMAGDDYGRISMPATFGMAAAEQRQRHHLELLIDAGHAEWTSHQKSIARITNAGYDFVNAVDQGEPYLRKFLERFNAGVRYAKAAKEVVDLLSGSGRG